MHNTFNEPACVRPASPRRGPARMRYAGRNTFCRAMSCLHTHYLTLAVISQGALPSKRVDFALLRELTDVAMLDIAWPGFAWLILV